MINKSKLTFVAAIALASMALPAFAQTATTAAYQHRYAHNRSVRNDYSRGENAYARVPAPSSNPVDDPAMTGGGSMGYNACAGHPRC
jgi:hypothetical protein